MEETINRVRQGSLDTNVGNTIGFLAGIQLKALTQAKSEEAEKSFGEDSNAAIYQSIFNRPRYTPLEQEVYDLYPNPKIPEKETEAAAVNLCSGPMDDLPFAGTKSAQGRPNEQPEVIKIDVG